MSKPVLGRALLDIVTSGMYNNPLMVLREYIQNAADSIDLLQNCPQTAEGRIDILIDGRTRTITITDNGVGVPAKQVSRVLCSLGASTKDGITNRGFRGIGRFGGLGYCRELCFESRGIYDDSVTTVRWDTEKLVEYVNQGGSLDVTTLVDSVVDVASSRASCDTPPHFFSVILKNIRSFHDDSLLDPQAIRAYLSQVAPVRYNCDTFPFAKQIESHLSDIDGFKHYCVTLNGEEILRPYAQSFSLSHDVTDEIRSIKLIKIVRSNGDTIGKGWIAETAYRASLPFDTAMRGIRIRQGNIEVGDEYFLAHQFTERRFATWHIGEIHLSTRVRPNARRDGFEHTELYECVLEHTALLCRQLSLLCRLSSKQRSERCAIEKHLAWVCEAVNYGIFLDDGHAKKGIEERLRLLTSIIEKSKVVANDANLKVAIERAIASLLFLQKRPPSLSSRIDGRKLSKISRKDLVREICERLLSDVHLKPYHQQMLKTALGPLLKTAREILRQTERPKSGGTG